MTEPNETAAERAIREALESVERIEREGRPPPARAGSVGGVSASDEEADQVHVVGGNDQPNPEELGAKPAAAQPAAKKTPEGALLEATLKAKQEMQEVLAQTQKEAKDMYDRLARVSADFDNYKKRVGREKQDAIKFANEILLKEMLPVVDNLQRALAASSADGNVMEGVKLVAKQFEDVLAKVGATGFVSVGEPFDPARHEAVGARPDPNVPAQHVAEEYQRGYMLHDRLLRPALVIVSSGPPAEGGAPGTPEN